MRMNRGMDGSESLNRSFLLGSWGLRRAQPPKIELFDQEGILISPKNQQNQPMGKVDWAYLVKVRDCGRVFQIKG